MRTAAFAIHGLTIGGPLAHLWYAAVNRLVGRGGGLLRLLTTLALDRVFYDSLQARTPLFPRVISALPEAAGVSDCGSLQIAATIVLFLGLGRLSTGWAALTPGGAAVGAIIADPSKVFWVGIITNWRVWLPVCPVETLQLCRDWLFERFKCAWLNGLCALPAGAAAKLFPGAEVDASVLSECGATSHNSQRCTQAAHRAHFEVRCLRRLPCFGAVFWQCSKPV
jgi:hypothetical protein